MKKLAATLIPGTALLVGRASAAMARAEVVLDKPIVQTSIDEVHSVL